MSDSSSFKAFSLMIQRDLTLSLRHRAQLANPILFFVLVISLFPLAIGAEPNTLARIAPGIIWVAALLASLLSLDGIFRSDFEDGTLELMLLSPHPAALLVLAKVLAHWLTTGAPLMLAAPLLAMMLGLDSSTYGVLLLTILLGTPVLSLIGAIGVALTLGLRNGGILLSLLVLPLYVPVLIFASSALESATLSLSVSAQLSMLGAFLFLALSLAPVAAAAALKMSMS